MLQNKVPILQKKKINNKNPAELVQKYLNSDQYDAEMQKKNKENNAYITNDIKDTKSMLISY